MITVLSMYSFKKVLAEYQTSKIMKRIDIHGDDIVLIIRNMNVYKPHGCDKMSERLIKINGKSLTLPLKLIFNSMLHEGMFPED